MGSTPYYDLFIASLVFLTGYCFHVLLYSYYRGLGLMGRANVWQCPAIAVGPLVLVMVFLHRTTVAGIVLLLSSLLYCSLFPPSKSAHGSWVRPPKR